jgi:hypothetical protein
MGPGGLNALEKTERHIFEIGPHRCRHGDVMVPSAITELMRSDKAHIMYSDPPWGGGNLKYWATMNKKHNGTETVPAELGAFLERIFGIARDHVSHYLLIEYGPRWKEMIQTYGIKAGFTPVGITVLKYRGGATTLPLDLHFFAKKGSGAQYPADFASTVQDSIGYETLTRVFGALAPALRRLSPQPIVLDPCCGMGYTSQAALDFGLVFRGNELNRTRLEKTLARLRKKAGAA